MSAAWVADFYCLIISNLCAQRTFTSLHPACAAVVVVFSAGGPSEWLELHVRLHPVLLYWFCFMAGRWQHRYMMQRHLVRTCATACVAIHPK